MVHHISKQRGDFFNKTCLICVLLNQFLKNRFCLLLIPFLHIAHALPIQRLRYMRPIG